MMQINADVTVDACGLNCPLPILKTKQALMGMEVGQVVKVIATDPTSVDDFPNFAKLTGNKLLLMKTQMNKQQFVYFIEK